MTERATYIHALRDRVNAKTLTLCIVWCGGCVQALPNPLPANHPANAQSAEARPERPSETLDLREAAAADGVLPPAKEMKAHDKQDGGMKGRGDK